MCIFTPREKLKASTVGPGVEITCEIKVDFKEISPALEERMHRLTRFLPLSDYDADTITWVQPFRIACEGCQLNVDVIAHLLASEYEKVEWSIKGAAK